MADPTSTVDASSKSPQRFRRTRIAVSLFFAVLTMALCVLWARSYWRHDGLFGWLSSANTVVFVSGGGWFEVRIAAVDLNRAAPEQMLPAFARTRIVSDSTTPDFAPKPRWSWAIQTTPSTYSFSTIAPYWFAVLVASTLIIVPWVKLQFSLRTMLIATTLLAVVLGLVCYTVR